MLERIAEEILGAQLTPKYLVSQVFGFAAMALMVISFQQKKQKTILMVQSAAGVLFIVSFFLQSAYTGCIMNFLAILRNVVYSQKGEKQWAKSKVIPALFTVLVTAGGLFTWEGRRSILTLFAMIITSLGNFSENAAIVRACSLPSSVSWLIYDAVVGNAAGVCNECFVSASIITGMIRHDLPKYRKKSRTQ